MPRSNKEFRSSQISAGQEVSHAIRQGWLGGYEKATPGKYTSEEGFSAGTPKIKGLKQKRIKQAFGRE